MGANKGSALACRDWTGYLADAMDDLLIGWDHYSDMAVGASSEDRSIAREELKALYKEWDGSAPTEQELEAFADRYDATLREKSSLVN
jgi:hypothetical protein